MGVNHAAQATTLIYARLGENPSRKAPEDPESAGMKWEERPGWHTMRGTEATVPA